MKRLLVFLLLFASSAFADPANYDFRVAQGEDKYYTITFTDSAGDPVDISTDTFYYTAVATWSTDTLTVTTFTKSDSGLGTTDTVTMKITSAASDIAPGYYNHALGRVFADGDKELVLTGRILVTENASPLGW